ncbi:hypothetical protein RRG08_003447 [Elysia crispata]|uniref:Uncharacterized protein n=1 Tax=Elysia crispata TaxID=231223 RepID=A0AAE1ABQ3_9GAST|nr:hypothetical protein RRG08_003447 [Elysia crispata]
MKKSQVFWTGPDQSQARKLLGKQKSNEQHQNNASTGSNDPRSFSTRDFGYSLYSVSQTAASRPGTSDIHFTQSPRPQLLDQGLRIFTLLSLPDQ